MAHQQKADATAVEELFEAAKLTEIQKSVARLAVRGYTYRQMAECLSVPYDQVRVSLSRAEGRLRRHQSILVGGLYRQIRWLLSAVRNVRDCRPARVQVYRERSFGWEKEPVNTRARCFGEVPEDLVFGDRRLLRWLPDVMADLRNPERRSAE